MKKEYVAFFYFEKGTPANDCLNCYREDTE